MKAIIIILVALLPVSFAQIDETYQLDDIDIYSDNKTTVIDISFSNIKGYRRLVNSDSFAGRKFKDARPVQIFGNMVGSGFYLSPAAVAPYGNLAILAWIVIHQLAQCVLQMQEVFLRKGLVA